jgi:hypothetical protein
MRQLRIVRWVGAAAILVGCSTKTQVDDGASGSTTVDVSAFVGQWSQHAGELNVSSNGLVNMSYQLFSLNGTAFPELRLKIISVANLTATAQVQASDDPRAQVDTIFTIRKVEPGLVVTSPAGSESVWCDDQHRTIGTCGA